MNPDGTFYSAPMACFTQSCYLCALQAAGNNTLVRFTIPAASATLRNISAVQAGQVRASTLSSTNYNSSVTMCVGTHSTTHTNTYATAMRFSVSNPANITYAVVRLTASSVSTSLTTSMPLLLLAIRDSTWTSANVTWNALAGPGSGPLLPHPPTASGWVVNSVAKNFINWNSTGIQIAGHVTIPPVTTTGAAGGYLVELRCPGSMGVVASIVTDTFMAQNGFPLGFEA